MAKNEIKINVLVDPSDAKKGVKSASGELDKLGSLGDKTATTLTGKISSAFSSMTGKASKSLGSLGGDVGGLGSTMGGLSVPLLAAGAGFAKFALDGAAKFGALGEKVETFKGIAGSTAESASKWVAVADDFGVSADELAGGFGKLAKTLGANAGALDEYGVSVKRTKDGTVDMNATALNVIDTYNKTVDPTIKAKLATEAFGKSYSSLIPLFDEGTANILDRMKQVDGAQMFSDDKLGEAKDYRLAMDDLHDALGDVQIQIGTALIPTLKGLGDIMSVASGESNTFFNVLTSGLRHNPIANIATLWDVAHPGVEVFIDDMDRVGFVTGHLNENLSIVAQADKKGIVASQGLTSAFDAQADATDKAAKALKGQKDALHELQGLQLESTNLALASQQADLGAADAIDKYSESLTLNKDKTKDNDVTQRELQQIFIGTQQSINDTAETYADYVVNQVKGTGQIIDAEDEARIRNQAQIDKLGELQKTVAPGSPLWNAIQQYIDHLNSIKTFIKTEVSFINNGVSVGGGKKAFATGTDRVPGMTGEPMLALVHGGERITPAAMAGASRGGNGGATIVNQYFDVPPNFDRVAFGRTIEEARQAFLRVGGTPAR